jgi:hypothetical protein
MLSAAQCLLDGTSLESGTRFRPMASKEVIESIEKMLGTSSSSDAAIARACGISCEIVREVRKGTHFHQQSLDEQARRKGFGGKRGSKLGAGDGKYYTPTREDIRRECERFRQLSPRRPVWTPPEFQFPEVDARIFEA